MALKYPAAVCRSVSVTLFAAPCTCRPVMLCLQGGKGEEESIDAWPVSGGAESKDSESLSAKEYQARVEELVEYLKALVSFHNVLKNTYVRSYFAGSPNPMFEYKRNQLEKSVEFLFAVTDPSAGVDCMDFNTIRCARFIMCNSVRTWGSNRFVFAQGVRGSYYQGCQQHCDGQHH